jgi:hypothetical protein
VRATARAPAGGALVEVDAAAAVLVDRIAGHRVMRDLQQRTWHRELWLDFPELAVDA